MRFVLEEITKDRDKKLHPIKLKCPYCKGNINSIRAGENSIVEKVSIMCSKCKRILEITTA